MTQIVNIRDTQYIGRAGKGEDGYFGNPFVEGKDGGRARVIERFRNYFYVRITRDSEFKKRVQALKGKTLICFCAPLPCHGDVIKEYLDQSVLRDESTGTFQSEPGLFNSEELAWSINERL